MVSEVFTARRAHQVAALGAGGSVFPDDEWGAFAEAATGPDELAAMVRRRLAGEPVQHIVGFARFADLRLAVAPGVFVPRWRTEFLAESTVRVVPQGGRVLDFACGCGAIAAVVAHQVPQVQVVAIDADEAAVACARRNLPDARVMLGDSLDVLEPGERFDVITANLPYVPTAEIALQPHEARDHEPWLALDGGHDGLEPLRRLAPGLKEHLRPGGHFLVETSEHQVPTTQQVLRSGELKTVHHLRSRERDATVVVAQC